MNVYYNEIDPYCCEWLRNLIDAGLLPEGEIDSRDIREVRGADLRGFDSCHFFAGIGGWPYALRLAGWPDDRPVWTGSCPCQPFSAAGKGKASSDERHLWPAWFELIKSCRPPVIFGEQVEAAIGWGWLDLVYSDLEKEGYTVGAAVLPAAGVGAPHIRQRLWFVANTESGIGQVPICERRPQQAVSQSRGPSGTGELADAECAEWGQNSPPYGGNQHDPLSQGQEGSGRVGERGIMGNANGGRCEQRDQSKRPISEPSTAIADSIVGVPFGAGLEGYARNGNNGHQPGRNGAQSPRSVAAPGWNDLIWLPCTDGKQRPTQSGIFPLAHGVPARVAKLRAAGNAIVPQVAAEFIKAAMT